MFKFIKKIQPLFNSIDVSIKSITILSIFSFYLITTFYASKIFYQFTTFKIVLLSFIFLILFSILVLIFDKDFFKERINLSISNISSMLVIVFLLILIASSAFIFIDYYRTFPLLEAELGLGAHCDTSFHLSLIQNIMSYGYPSTGQHGTPVIYYHVLSHYVDAFILLITNIDPYSSYGLFFYFKIFLLLSSILVFLSQTIKGKQALIFIFSILVIAPILISTWSLTGSHSLWFTSIIIILSANKIFTLLGKKEKNSIQDYIYIFILILIFSIGKISTGFMYATFIGMYLFLKEWKEYKVYLMGILWIVFFILYRKLIVVAESSQNIGFDLNALYHYYIDVSSSKMLLSIYTSTFILFVLFLLFRTKENFRFLASSIFSLIVLGITVTLNPNLPSGMIFYFEFGLAFILILFMFQNIFYNIKLNSIRFVVLLLLTSLSSFYFLPKFNILNMNLTNLDTRLKSLNNTPFSNINKTLPPKTEKITFMNGGINKTWYHDQKRPLVSFKKALEDFLLQHMLNKKDVLLFIPKEIYENDLSFIKRRTWSKGLFIYAITGVPLLYGNKEMQSFYGYKRYAEDSLWVSNDAFNLKKSCDLKLTHTIIFLQSFKNLKFTILNCEK